MAAKSAKRGRGGGGKGTASLRLYATLPLTEMPFSRIVELVAHEGGSPGGGSVAALAAAGAGALLTLACQVTAANEDGGCRTGEAELLELARAAESLGRRLCCLAEEDHRSYDLWRKATRAGSAAGTCGGGPEGGLSGPVGPEEGITAVPCQIGEACAELAELARRVAVLVRREDLRADIRIATLLTVASGRAAIELIETNAPQLSAVKADAYKRFGWRLRERLERAETELGLH